MGSARAHETARGRMSGLSEILLAEIAAGRDEWIGLLQGFVRTPTPNPPGDTRAGTARLAAFLAGSGIGLRLLAHSTRLQAQEERLGATQPGLHRETVVPYH